MKVYYFVINRYNEIVNCYNEILDRFNGLVDRYVTSSLPTMLSYFNFQPLKVVFRYRDPQIQVDYS